jgi:hypothetical protein
MKINQSFLLLLCEIDPKQQQRQATKQQSNKAKQHTTTSNEDEVTLRYVTLPHPILSHSVQLSSAYPLLILLSIQRKNEARVLANGHR